MLELQFRAKQLLQIRSANFTQSYLRFFSRFLIKFAIVWQPLTVLPSLAQTKSVFQWSHWPLAMSSCLPRSLVSTCNVRVQYRNPTSSADWLLIFTKVILSFSKEDGFVVQEISNAALISLLKTESYIYTKGARFSGGKLLIRAYNKTIMVSLVSLLL